MSYESETQPYEPQYSGSGSSPSAKQSDVFESNSASLPVPRPKENEQRRGRLSNFEENRYRYGRRNSSTQTHERDRLETPHHPRFHRLLSSHYILVTNPNPNPSDGFSSKASLHEEEPLKRPDSTISFIDQANQIRQEIMNEMRPMKLIGNACPLARWPDFYISTKDIKLKPLREYYNEQNLLLEKFTEIDNFLDAGKMHVNMLSSYGATIPTRNPPNMNPTNTLGLKPDPELTATTLQESGSQNSKLRLLQTPGNVDLEGAQFLNYNQEEDEREVEVAIMVNFVVNILLLIGKLIVTLMTNSMSVVASLVDSVLDFLSTFIIYIANKLTNSKSIETEHAYPVGRSRLEPLGVLVFSIIIIVSFLQVGEEAFKRLFFSDPKDHFPVAIGASAGAIMVLTIVAKIACWLWCKRSKSSSVQALAQDAETDIVFNTISLLMPTLGHWLGIWWFDSAGALLLSIYIVKSWAATGVSHIDNLTGAAADPIDYKVILYLAYRFAESISEITALKVYHVGDNLNVEIDLIFGLEEFNLSMKDCHDIAEALQYAIETLPMVERAFVHIDHMEGNFKGHLR